MPQDNSPLSLYLAYDVLPVHQQAQILSAIGGVYDIVLYNFLPLSEIAPYWVSPHLLLAPGSLCIESVATGDSITFKFAPKGQVWPDVKFTGSELELLLPRWTAAAVVTGSLLSGGLWMHNELLDGELKIAQTENARIDTDKKRLEINKLLEEMQRVKSYQPGDLAYPAKVELDIQLQSFNKQIYMPNIQQAKVNGVPVKQPRHPSNPEK